MYIHIYIYVYTYIYIYMYIHIYIHTPFSVTGLQKGLSDSSGPITIGIWLFLPDVPSRPSGIQLSSFACGSCPNSCGKGRGKNVDLIRQHGGFDQPKAWCKKCKVGFWHTKDFINHSEFDHHELGTKVVTPANQQWAHHDITNNVKRGGVPKQEQHELEKKGPRKIVDTSNMKVKGILPQLSSDFCGVNNNKKRKLGTTLSAKVGAANDPSTFRHKLRSSLWKRSKPLARPAGFITTLRHWLAWGKCGPRWYQCTS